MVRNPFWRTRLKSDVSRSSRQMVAVNEAVSLGLSLCRGVGLEDLPTLCRGGETISLLRLFHYFPYRNDANPDRDTADGGGFQSGEHPARNDSNPDSNTDRGDCKSGERPDLGGEGEAVAVGVGAVGDQDVRTRVGETSTSGSAVSSRDDCVGTPEQASVHRCQFMVSN